MNKYTIYCTVEQTKKAYNLDAPLRKFTAGDTLTDSHWVSYNNSEIYTPTAEIEDWEPDWVHNNYKYAIEVYADNIQVYKYNYTHKCLSFPSETMAKEFADCFKDLLREAKMLL